MAKGSDYVALVTLYQWENAERKRQVVVAAPGETCERVAAGYPNAEAADLALQGLAAKGRVRYEPKPERPVRLSRRGRVSDDAEVTDDTRSEEA